MAKKSYSHDRTMQNEWYRFVASIALILSLIYLPLLFVMTLFTCPRLTRPSVWRQSSNFWQCSHNCRTSDAMPSWQYESVNFFYGGDTFFEIKPWTVLHHFYLELFNMFDIYFNTNHHRYHLIFWLYHREDHQSVFVLIALASLDEYSCVSSYPPLRAALLLVRLPRSTSSSKWVGELDYSLSLLPPSQVPQPTCS